MSTYVKDIIGTNEIKLWQSFFAWPDYAYKSIEDMAERSEISKSSAKRIVSKFQKLGIISHEEGIGSEYKANHLSEYYTAIYRVIKKITLINAEMDKKLDTNTD